LDPAFLRHGRFDYVIPIGLPDAQARAAIWSAHLPAQARDGIDLDALVAASDGFSPADIEFAARKASQAALERALEAETSDAGGPYTADYLAALRETTATVSPDVVEEFLDDITRLARR